MAELFQSALPYQAAVVAGAFLLCLAPHLARTGRGLVAILLLLAAIGVGVHLLMVDHSIPRTLLVPNAFGRGPDGDLFLWTVATVTAPVWHWHVMAIAVFLTPALLLWMRRHRPPTSPRPLAMAAMLFWFFLAARLGLEATAAPREVVWGIGGTVTLVAVLPFFGFWCGRAGTRFGRFVLLLIVLALVQRIPLVGFAYYATTNHLGTHLDTHVVTDIALRPFGELQLEDDFDRWLWPHLVPHLTLWVVVTMVAGIVLGSIPRWLGSRGANRSTARSAT